jgi:oligoribonuclease (3'-5' exoribonuclease)
VLALALAQGPDIAIHHPESVLAGMNQWCQDHHHKSGLVQRVRDSTISLQEAEQQVRRRLVVSAIRTLPSQECPACQK